MTAIAFGVLFLYTTWEYAEAAATLTHLRAHLKLTAIHAAPAVATTNQANPVVPSGTN